MIYRGVRTKKDRERRERLEAPFPCSFLSLIPLGLIEREKILE